jgi:hypothetical protein
MNLKLLNSQKSAYLIQTFPRGGNAGGNARMNQTERRLRGEARSQPQPRSRHCSLVLWLGSTRRQASSYQISGPPKTGYKRKKQHV